MKILVENLQVEEKCGFQVPMRMDLGSSSTPVPAKQLQGTPPVVTRRILDLLSYLARHQNSKVAEVFLDFEVSLPRDSFASSGPMETGKFPASDSKVVCSALEVLLQMLGQPLCQRSVSALEQNLHLLEVVMQCATTKVASSERATTRKSQTRRRRVDDGSMVSFLVIGKAPLNYRFDFGKIDVPSVG